MSEKPNVLLVSIDSLRADATSFGGNDAGTTPELADFAELSTVYENAITPSTWTLPVHTSVFTGLYPLEHQMIHKDVTLGDTPTLAEHLSDDGYQTEAFYYNSWLDVGEILRGFSQPHEETTESETQTSRTKQIADVLDSLSPRLKQWGAWLWYNWGRRMHYSRFPESMGMDDTTVERQVDRLKTVEKPFFHFVHLNDAHLQYTPPRPFHRQFGSHSRKDLFWNRFYWQPRIYSNRRDNWAGEMTVPEKQRTIIKDLYKGSVRRVDSLVGRILSTLADEEMLEETIVVVFGDHGDNFGEDGLYGHHFSLSNALINVPFLIHDPTDRLPVGQTDDLVQLNDIYPTILDLCGISHSSGNSVSLVDEDREVAYSHYELADKQLEEMDDSFIESLDEFPPREQLCALRKLDDKLVWYPEEDRYAGPSAGDDTLRRELERFVDNLAPVTADESSGPSDEIVENLREMGYL